MKVDLSDSVLVSLDVQKVIDAKNGHAVSGAPSSLKAKLQREIITLIYEPLSNWMNRSINRENDISRGNFGVHYPYSAEIINRTAGAVQQLFMKTNLSLMTARECTGIYILILI